MAMVRDAYEGSQPRGRVSLAGCLRESSGPAVPICCGERAESLSGCACDLGRRGRARASMCCNFASGDCNYRIGMDNYGMSKFVSQKGGEPVDTLSLCEDDGREGANASVRSCVSGCVDAGVSQGKREGAEIALEIRAEPVAPRLPVARLSPRRRQRAGARRADRSRRRARQHGLRCIAGARGECLEAIGASGAQCHGPECHLSEVECSATEGGQREVGTRGEQPGGKRNVVAMQPTGVGAGAGSVGGAGEQRGSQLPLSTQLPRFAALVHAILALRQGCTAWAARRRSGGQTYAARPSEDRMRAEIKGRIARYGLTQAEST